MGFDDAWATADPEGNNENPPRDGLHDVALVDAAAFTSKAGDDYVKFEWQTVNKENQWTQMGGFKSLKAAGFTKGQCMQVGVNVDSVSSLEELDSALKEFIGHFYEVEVEANGSFTNTYVRDGQGTPAPDVPAEDDFQTVPAADEDDGVPF